MTKQQLAEIRSKCKTQPDIIVAYLWHHLGWVPTHQLHGVDTPFGFIGSAGAVRVRELARGDCAQHLKGKVDRARGGEIGLDARYEYFRYRPSSAIPPSDGQRPTREEAERQGRENCEWFENYQPTK
jgi:hypothetical protein